MSGEHIGTRQCLILDARTLILCLFVWFGLFRLVGLENRREEMMAVFLVGTSIALVIYLFRTDKWISSFLLLACFSQFIPGASPLTHDAFNLVFFGCVWYLIVVSVFDRESVDDWLNAFCLIAIGNVVYLILQHFDIERIVKLHDPKNLVATLSNKNEASALLAYNFAAFLRSKWIWFLPVIGLGFVLTRSFGGPFAAAVGIGFYCAIQGGKVLWFIPVAGVATVLYLIFVDVPYMRRFEALWIVMTKYFPKSPWVGSGIGHWAFIFKPVKVCIGNDCFLTKILPDKSKLYYYEYAHNVFVHMLFEIGPAFIVILFGYLRKTILNFRKNALIPATALVIIAVNSFYHYGWHTGTTAWTGVTWMALYQIKTNGRLAA